MVQKLIWCKFRVGEHAMLTYIMETTVVFILDDLGCSEFNCIDASNIEPDMFSI